MPKTYYEVLGVPRDAPTHQIRAAYISLAREYHPDVNRDQNSNQRMAELNLAYEVLSDRGKRLRHDTEIALRDPVDELKHAQAVALAVAAARLVAPYCPDPLVTAALDAAEVYALRPLPSSAFLASLAADALTRPIFGEPALGGPAGILAADSAAKAARAAAAAATAPQVGAEAWVIETWRGMNARWLRRREGEYTVAAWPREATLDARFALLEAFRRAAKHPRGPAPGQRELEKKLEDLWSSWTQLLVTGMTPAEFLQRRAVDPSLEQIVESTLRTDISPGSGRRMEGELIPMSKPDKDRLDEMYSAQSRLAEDIKEALKNPLSASGLNVADRDALLAQCVERYKDCLPISVLVNTVFATPFAVQAVGSWWSPPFLKFQMDLALESLRALQQKEEFKVDWSHDDHPSQIVIQTASGPATFRISESQSNFPRGERIDIRELRVRQSAAFLSRNRRYTFELDGWG